MAQGSGVIGVIMKYKDGMEAILTALHITFFAVILFGGWSLFHYCQEFEVPFPSEIPTLITIVSVVGCFFAIGLSGFLLLPMLSKTGGLGETYTWLIASAENKKGKLFGFVLIPAFVFEAIFLLMVIISPALNNELDECFKVALVAGPLISISITAFYYFEAREWLGAWFGAVYLALIVIMWLLIVLLLLTKVLSGWVPLLIAQSALLYFLYITVVPEDKKTDEARKNWSIFVTSVFLILMIYPHWTVKIMEKTLHALKLGGGYRTSYTLVETYCREVQSTICNKSNNQTVDLELILDNGEQVYVRVASSNPGKENEPIGGRHMLPWEMIVDQEFGRGKTVNGH